MNNTENVLTAKIDYNNVSYKSKITVCKLIDGVKPIDVDSRYSEIISKINRNGEIRKEVLRSKS